MFTHVVEFEVKDYDPSYGFFGKTVCRSDVSAMTEAEKMTEKVALSLLFPGHSIVEVFEVPAMKGVN